MTNDAIPVAIRPAASPACLGAVLFAADCETLAAFYAEVCGFDVAGRGDGFVMLAGNGFELVVHATAASIAPADPPRRRTRAPIKLVFVVADIETARGIVERRAGVLDPPEREWRFDHWRVLDGHDSEGNVFQIRERATSVALSTTFKTSREKQP